MSFLDNYPNKSTQTASRVVDGEAVIVQPMEGSINTLNEVGTRVWELTDGSRTVREIAAEIQNEFDVELATAEADTTIFIEELVEKNMIEFVSKM